MSSLTMSPVDANVRHVVRNVLTLLTSIWPESSLSAATSRPRVPYLMTLTSSSRHCSRPRLSSSTSSTPVWWHPASAAAVPDDVPDDASSTAPVSDEQSLSVFPSSRSSWLSRSCRHDRQRYNDTQTVKYWKIMSAHCRHCAAVRLPSCVYSFNAITLTLTITHNLFS